MNATEVEEALRELAGTFAPSDPAEYRRHLLDTKIYPTVAAWGFSRRFGQEGTMRDQQADVFEALCNRMNGKGSIVALVGTRGTGKTTIAAQFAILTAWNNHEQAAKAGGPKWMPHVIYKKCLALMARYKPIFADFGTIESTALTESLDYLCRQQEFLVIDEVHERDDSSLKARILTDIIDRRYACCRDTVLISNQTAEEFARTIGDSILSRLNEHGCIIPCHWPTFRGQ